MASKEKLNNATGGEEQTQQPVVDRDKVKQEREARRQAKLNAKQKVQDKGRNLPNSDDKMPENKAELSSKVEMKVEKKVSPKKETATDKNAHRKTEKHGKEVVKKEAINTETLTNDLDKLKLSNETGQASTSAAEKLEKKQLSKAERRAIQEAQRAAKVTKTTEKVPAQTKKESPAATKSSSTGTKPKQQNTPSTSKVNTGTPKPVPGKKQHRVKLFSHLYTNTSPENVLNSSTIHPAIVRLGVQYSSGVVKGCNARGLAFMNAIKSVIAEYDTPSQKEFSRGLEDVIKSCGNYLQQCRPLAVSVTNAMKFIQFQLHTVKPNQLGPGQANKSKSDIEVSYCAAWNA